MGNWVDLVDNYYCNYCCKKIPSLEGEGLEVGVCHKQVGVVGNY